MTELITQINTLGNMTWLVLMVAFLIIEIATMGLTTLWFAGGALAAFLVGVVGGPIWLQVLVFFAVSIILLLFTRPIAVKYYNKNRTKTNAESLIGQHAVVKEEINNLEGKGKVYVNGMEWTARTRSDEERIAVESTVSILEIQGVKLIVERVQ